MRSYMLNVLYLIWGLIKVLYIFKIFAFLKIKFLTIEPIISFDLDTRDRIWLSTLNLLSMPTSYTVFLIYLLISLLIHFQL